MNAPDLIDLITQAREKLDAALDAETAKRTKIDTALLLANCLAMLKDIPTGNLSHDKRLRLYGLRQQLSETLKGAA